MNRVLVVGLLLGVASCGGASDPFLEREAFYRANNRGVALLEQFDYERAADAFREALALDTAGAVARINLAVALFLSLDLEDAEREATLAADALPSAPQPFYLLGLIARAQSRPEAAIDAFSIVLAADPRDVGTNVNLGQMYLEVQEYPAAIERLRVAYEDEPFNITAAYNLGLALTRNGAPTEGQLLLERVQALRSTDYAVTYDTGYLQQGRYAEAIASTGAEAGLIDTEVPAATFTSATIASSPAGSVAPDTVSPFGRRFTADDLTDQGARALAASLGGGVTLIDFDRDDDLDLFVATPEGQQLLRNDTPDGWTDVTQEAGLDDVPANSVPVGAIAADYDNDEVPDLFVLRYGTSSLYRNAGADGFTDVTPTAGLPDYPHLPGAAAFVDLDHDGDVDLAIAGLADLTASRTTIAESAVFPEDFVPAPFLLLRNNQDGTFTDITEASQLAFDGHVVAVVPTDFDNRRDLDLLVVERGGPPRLFTNLRDSTFRDVASEVGLAAVGADIASVAVADVNKDGFSDFVFGRVSDNVFAFGNGQGGFGLVEAPATAGEATALRFLDYDNDGLLDLLAWVAAGPQIFRNLGDTWDDVTGAAGGDVLGGPPIGTAHAVAIADLDLDGDSDIVRSGAGVVSLATNSGDPRNQSLRITLRGLVSNRTGVGARVQLRAGSLSSELETSAATPAVAAADLVFGLGPRPGADVARVLWPSGILQAEVPATAGEAPGASAFLLSPRVVRELDREPSSCPFLFTWNGTEFEFVTDFLGGGEMGYWHGPDFFNTPDPVEYVRIGNDQLRARDGVFELKVTNELEEAVFFDRVELIALTHRENINLYPNEGMTAVPKPHRLHGVAGAHVPTVALDDEGRDVTDQIARIDRRYAEGFAFARFRGYAEPHTLTLDLGPLDGPTVLLLTGWTRYSFSSDNVAAFQAGLTPMVPALEIKDAAGRWRPAGVEIGIPVGRPQTIAVDLGDDLRPGEHEVRIVTSMRIYWDQILVGRRAPVTEVREHAIDPSQATLRARGFSASLRTDGTQPTTYDYGRVTRVSPWKTMAGSYTREGDVLDLLRATDDMFVIAKDGDEIALTFDATGLDPLPQGWTRSYLLRADGFSKEMDINSASPDTVEPLPFHAMSGYPYGPAEHYPESAAHRQYRERYNTRTVVKQVPSIDASTTP